MTTSQFIILGLAAFVFVTDVAMGLYFRGMTPEKLARAKSGHGLTQGAHKGVESYHMLGNVLVASAPVISGVLVWVALGMEG